jgi:hypothetical protein
MFYAKAQNFLYTFRFFSCFATKQEGETTFKVKLLHLESQLASIAEEETKLNGKSFCEHGSSGFFSFAPRRKIDEISSTETGMK